jgi:hypothetical protein
MAQVSRASATHKGEEEFGLCLQDSKAVGEALPPMKYRHLYCLRHLTTLSEVKHTQLSSAKFKVITVETIICAISSQCVMFVLGWRSVAMQ